MKKLMFCLATMIASVGVLSAANNYSESAAYGIDPFAESIDGTYDGTATATKMNGKDLDPPVSVAGSFTITDGILQGGFNVGPHSFTLIALDEIPGEGPFNVDVVGTVGTQTYSGTAIGNVANGVLTFVCDAFLDDTGAESIFNFVGYK